MEDEIDLRDIFRVIWKGRFLIGAIFIISILIAAAMTLFTPQVYDVYGMIAVGNFEDPIYTSQASAKEIMLSDGFLMEVAERLNLNNSSGKLSTLTGSIKIEPVTGSDKLLVILVETKRPQEGKEIVDEIIRLFADRNEESYNKQKKILSDQLEFTQEQLDIVDEGINQTQNVLKNLEDAPGSSAEIELRISRTLDNLNAQESWRTTRIDRRLELQKQLSLLKTVEVVQEAKVPDSPVNSKGTLYVAIAGMLGLMVGLFAAFLREGLKSPAK